MRRTKFSEAKNWAPARRYSEAEIARDVVDFAMQKEEEMEKKTRKYFTAVHTIPGSSNFFFKSIACISDSQHHIGGFQARPRYFVFILFIHFP